MRLKGKAVRAVLLVMAAICWLAIYWPWNLGLALLFSGYGAWAGNRAHEISTSEGAAEVVAHGRGKV